ncbi:hypothetical protein [uncultured Roseobacter sp.]|uniref:hypothetical protein n=1 Tax=uncultured Roseobacter sp. TaxID=114847 RepID=UPI0026227EC6|nr:hypothetical protein [uncultured Roseobacter sp.]
MSTTEKNNEHIEPTRARRPDMIGYSVRQIGDGKKSSWSRVAAAWAHKDGQGFEVRMDAVPVDGRLVLREPSDDRQAEGDVIERSPAG